MNSRSSVGAKRIVLENRSETLPAGEARFLTGAHHPQRFREFIANI